MHRVLWPFRHPRLILILLVVIVSVAVPLTHKPKTASAANTYVQHVKSGDDWCSGGICGMVSDLLSVPTPRPCPVHAKLNSAGTACVSQQYGAYDGSYFGTRKKADGSLRDTCYDWEGSPGVCSNFSYGPWYYKYTLWTTMATWINLDNAWMGGPNAWNRSGWQRPTWNGYNSNIEAAYICSGTGAPNGCTNDDDYPYDGGTSPGAPKKGIEYNREFYLDHPRWQIDSVTFRYQAAEWGGAIVDGGLYFPACYSGELEAGFTMSYDDSSNPQTGMNKQWILDHCREGANNPGIYRIGALGRQLVLELQNYNGESQSPPQHDYIAMEVINRFNNTDHPAIAYHMKIQYKEPSCVNDWQTINAGHNVSFNVTGPKYARYSVTGSAGGTVPNPTGGDDGGNYSFIVQNLSPDLPQEYKTVTIEQRSRLDSRAGDRSYFYCHVHVNPPPLASCSVTGVSPASPFTGHGVTITVSLKNETAAGGPDFDGNYRLYQTSTPPLNPSDTPYRSGFYLSRGSSTDLSYANAVRGSPTTVTFYYWLVDGDGDRVDGGVNGVRATDGNPLCQKTVTWKPPIASCSASATPPKPFIGHGASIVVNVINQSDAGTPGFNSSYILKQVSSDGRADQKNLSDNLATGDSQNILFNETRGSPGDIVFTYRLYDDVNNLVIGKTNNGNPLCQTTVTWRQLPVKPYFKAYGGDVFTGGAFDKKDSPCSNSASDYQAPTFGSISTYSKGGIYAFANSGIGASSEYAGFALGNINGSTDTDRSDDVLQYGFYTYGITMPIKQRQNTLSFANELPSVVGSDSTYWGGYFGGAVRQLHCVTDYFYTKKSASTPTVPSVDLATITNGQYLINTSTTTSTPISGNISANPDNNRITIFVKGNVYIAGNITYPACTITSCYGSGSAPKFALIVQGNIYIDPSVSRLDGLYIAQPDDSNVNGTGVIWTCHGSGGAYNSSEVISNCRNKLTFNGAVIAKQMNLWRTNDGINSRLDTNQPGDPNIPAEEFNYTPEMVIGNPFFNQSNGSQDYTVDSVITLPPVY